MKSALQNPHPPDGAVPDAEKVESVTREVLSRSEFQQGVFEDWIEYAGSLLWNRLSSLADWAEAHPTLRWVVAALLVAQLLLLVGHMLYTIGKGIPSGRSIRQLGLSRAGAWEILDGKARSWEEALRVARRALAGGDLYQAVWIGHRLLLGLLDQKGALRFLKWKTNSDYLKECSSQADGYRLLRDFSQAYDDVVYAHREASSHGIEELLNQIDEILKGPAFSH
ncbi:MAG: hypothetical protein V3T83_19745 [Acidobacteriota bacterium]